MQALLPLWRASARRVSSLAWRLLGTTYLRFAPWRAAAVGMAMDWVSILAYITRIVGQEFLLRNEYLAAEKRILKAQLKTLPGFTYREHVTLAKIPHRVSR